MSRAISVKNFLPNHPTGQWLPSAALTLITICLLWPIPDSSGDSPGAKQPVPSARIFVSSDRLMTDNRKKVAEFTGNVKVTRADSVITTDRLKVFYTDSSGDKRTANGSKTDIEKIVAEGNVHIRSADLVAVAQKGIYNKKTQKITLLGTGTRVTSGGSSITGTKIILFIDQDRIRVSSGPDNRVKAILNPATPKK